MQYQKYTQEIVYLLLFAIVGVVSDESVRQQQCESVLARTIHYCPSCGVHGVLMFLGFAVFMAFGIFISRYLRFRPWFFGLHICAQAAALSFIIPAFVISLTEMEGVLSHHEGGPKREWIKAHSIIGYAALGLVFVQVLLGGLAYITYNPQRRTAPFLPDRVHWLMGWTILTLALVTSFLGLKIMGMPWYYMMIMGVYIAFMVAFAIYMEGVTARDQEVAHLKDRWDHRGHRRYSDLGPEEVPVRETPEVVT
jgi:uncharacterized membrane protein